jgi:hypothetical protein
MRGQRAAPRAVISVSGSPSTDAAVSIADRLLGLRALASRQAAINAAASAIVGLNVAAGGSASGRLAV